MQHILVAPKFLLVFVTLILGLNILGNTQEWSWTLSHYDTVLHALGGFWITGIFLYGLQTRITKNPQERYGVILFIAAIGFTAIVGIGWEVFEFFLDTFFIKDSIPFRAQPSLTDTMIDLVADVMGAFIFLSMYRNKNISHKK
ncbi:MAG: hypothetical protein AAB407_00530 [Patescibacteria group bacterium]